METIDSNWKAKAEGEMNWARVESRVQTLSLGLRTDLSTLRG